MSTRSVRAREIAGEKNYLQDAQQPSGGLQSPEGLYLEDAQQIHGQPQTREGQQTPRHIAEFADDVRASLTKKNQRELPSKYLYDELGSALFEAICVLPEYGLTRADARLLQRHAAEIVERLPSPVQVAELGSGSGKKTRWLLKALSRREHV